jgi:YVTN family beta-propeller protein
VIGRRAAVSIGALLAVTISAASSPALQIDIVYDDAPGEGFLDADRGAERRAAFAAAVEQWSLTLGGSMPILIAANMRRLGGSGADALLASGGAVTVHRNFDRAGRLDTWYAVALANQFAGVDLNGSSLAEVGVTFNADVDQSDVLGSISWYYGLDARPGADIDFVTIALHEIGHGLGFLDTVNAANGAWGLGDPSILEHMLARPEISRLADMLPAERLAAIVAPADLLWSGPAVVAFNGSPLAVYSPEPFRQGSSIAHWHTDLPSPELMQPFYSGANHDLGALLPALIDMGWPVAVDTPTPRAGAATPTATRPPRPSPTPPGTPRLRREMVYVTNFDDATVSAIEAQSRTVVESIAVDDGPIGIAASADGRRLYVAGFQAGTVSMVRTGDHRVIASVPLGESPNSIAVTPDGAFVAVTDTAADRVWILAGETLDILAPVPGGRQPSGIALDGSGRLAFVSNFSGASVTVVDLDARRRRAIMLLPFTTASDGLLGIAIAPATGRGFVTSFYQGWLGPVWADLLVASPGSFPFANGVRPEAVVTNAAGSLAYVVGHDRDTGTGRLAVLRMEDQRVVTPIVQVGRVPEALALSPDETRLYVANTGANSVSVVDTLQRRVVATVAVGRAPMGIAVAAVPDGQCPEECQPPTPSPPPATHTPVLTATATAAAMRCGGDCNGDRIVTVNELVRSVSIALGRQPAGACEAADMDGDGRVTIAELVAAVDRFLTGCSV